MKRGLPLACLVLALSARAQAGEPKRFYQMSPPEIARTLRDIHKENPALADRVAAVSERFLGAPYDENGPLGEGPKGEFDRDPLIRFDTVDCTTLVEETMALALEPNLKKAVRVLQKIRYKGGKIRYEDRNHFPEADWLPNNIEARYIRDITREVAGDKTLRAGKVISKRKWYEAKSLQDIQGFNEASFQEKAERLYRLRALGSRFPDRLASVPYMPIQFLPSMLGGIPSGTVANLIREDSPDRVVLISHQVLIIEKNGVKYVRQATLKGVVQDIPALEYFYRYFNSSWKLLGLNLDAIRDPRKR